MRDAEARKDRNYSGRDGWGRSGCTATMPSLCRQLRGYPPGSLMNYYLLGRLGAIIPIIPVIFCPQTIDDGLTLLPGHAGRTSDNSPVMSSAVPAAAMQAPGEYRLQLIAPANCFNSSTVGYQPACTGHGAAASRACCLSSGTGSTTWALAGR
ncbi:hypothetical protein BO78DRAFT_395182, partial [Aspergillus sclerotiicarbonarius CBS 121057]